MRIDGLGSMSGRCLAHSVHIKQQIESGFRVKDRYLRIMAREEFQPGKAELVGVS